MKINRFSTIVWVFLFLSLAISAFAAAKLLPPEKFMTACIAECKKDEICVGDFMDKSFKIAFAIEGYNGGIKAAAMGFGAGVDLKGNSAVFEEHCPKTFKKFK